MTFGARLAATAFAHMIAVTPLFAQSADIGQVKVVKGTVTIERSGQALATNVGMRVQAGDIVRTGGDASVGITMIDDTLLSAGPNSVLTLERLEYQPTTHTGRLDTTLATGTLAVVSGRIAKQSPDAMTVRTPFAILGVRGTEFAVSAHEPLLTNR